jgi:hypothetical protein
MALAQIGPLTTLTEAAAASVAAGVVLTSVAAGVLGLTTGRSRDEIEEWALRGGYFGGGVGAGIALVDAALRCVIL